MASTVNRPDYIADIDGALVPEAREFLENYIHLAAHELIAHIEASRQEAWRVFPYPCVGMLTWLKSYITLNPAYGEILQRLKAGETIIDCGCFYARDLRQLSYAGAPTDRMLAFDVEPAWFDLGYSFFRDRARFLGRFFAADAWDESATSELSTLEGEIDVVWAAKFLHLYGRAMQIKLLARLVKLLKPNGLLVGSHNGLPQAQEVTMSGRTVWVADEDAFRELWHEMAEQTNTRWELRTKFINLRDVGWMERKENESEYEQKIGYNIQFAGKFLGIR